MDNSTAQILDRVYSTPFSRFRPPLIIPASVLTFNDPRTIPQVLAHFILLRVFIFLAKNYLSHLQAMSRSARIKSITLFIALPTFPLASLICRTFFCIYIALSKPWPSSRGTHIVYLLCAALGMKAWNFPQDIEEKGTDSSTAQAPKRNVNTVYLLHGEPEEYIRIQCSCGKIFCSRWDRNMLGRLAFLALTFYYSAATLFLYTRRIETTWQFAGHSLLTGTPPGQHDADIPGNGLGVLTGLDELNGIFALGGLTVSFCAMVIEVTGWKWKYIPHETEPARNEALHFKSFRHSGMDARFELPLAMLLFAAFTRNSWVRIFEHWDTMSAGIRAIMGGLCAFLGGNFLISYIPWVVGWKIGERKHIFVRGIILVSEWVVLYAVMDLFDIGACLRGGKCHHPLFLFKDEWSDSLWVY